MIRIKKSGQEDAPYLVSLKSGDIFFSRNRLIELRDKINLILKEKETQPAAAPTPEKGEKE
jgi:hypothetical protein